MKLEPIFTSLLETDLYKFNMGNVIFKKFNNYTTRWTFKCRNENVRFTEEMVQEIREQFDHYCSLRFTKSELAWLKENLPWLSEGYLHYLEFWHPVREEVLIQVPGEGFGEGPVCVPYNDCGLAIEAVGTWLNTSMYEIALLAIVNEVYFALSYCYPEDLFDDFKERTRKKISGICGLDYEIGAFSEFGLRRRLSGKSHDWLIENLKNVPGFVGTSNVFLAKKHGVKAIGTMAPLPT